MGRGIVRTLKSYGIDLNDTFAFTSPRTVKIRDARLGGTLLVLQLAVFAYVIGYQLLYLQSYQVASTVVAQSRMSLQRPTAAYRWAAGQAPYCLGGSPPAASGYVAANGEYSYRGGPPQPQQTCVFLDELGAAQGVLERDSIFLTTRVTQSTQAAAPAAACAGVGATACAFVGVTNTTWVVPDVEFFTLLVDHSMYAPAATLTRTVRQMTGSMRVRATDVSPLASTEERTAAARRVDPCAAYASAPYDGAGAACPPFVNVGTLGAQDIVPIKTLLSAAGIASLDAASGSSPGESMRVAGLVLILEVQYSNYFTDTGSFDNTNVAYTYYVSAVSSAEFKYEEAVGLVGLDAGGAPVPGGVTPAVNASARIVTNRHGLRVLLSFSGRIGSFNLQAFLINLFVSLGLLGAASAIMELIVFYTPSPFKSVLWQFKQRETVDFSALRSRHADAAALRAVLARFDAGEELVDAPPPVFQPLIDAVAAARRVSAGGVGDGGGARAAGGATATANPVAGGSGGSGERATDWPGLAHAGGKAAATSRFG